MNSHMNSQTQQLLLYPITQPLGMPMHRQRSQALSLQQGVSLLTRAFRAAFSSNSASRVVPTFYSPHSPFKNVCVYDRRESSITANL